MSEAKYAKQPDPRIELLIGQLARDKTDITKWGLNIAIILFAILIIVIILIAQGIGTDIVALVAVLGLGAVWVSGQRRGRQLYPRFYAEMLSSLQQESRKETENLVAKLTSRESQVLDYVAQGYANKQIAFELGISENTVKNFISRVFAKLNANDRTEAAVIAIKHGLVSLR